MSLLLYTKIYAPILLIEIGYYIGCSNHMTGDEEKIQVWLNIKIVVWWWQPTTYDYP